MQLHNWAMIMQILYLFLIQKKNQELVLSKNYKERRREDMPLRYICEINHIIYNPRGDVNEILYKLSPSPGLFSGTSSELASAEPVSK